MIPVAIGHHLPERGGVVEVRGLAGQVVGGVVGEFAACWVQAAVGGGAADRAGDLAGVSFEHPGRLEVHPFGGVQGGEQAAGSGPQVFQDVDEVDDDVDLYASGFGLGFDQFDRARCAVDENDPGARVLAVA